MTSFLKKYWNKYKNAKLKYRISIPVFCVLFVWYLFCLPSPLFDVPYSTVVTDKNGDLLGARIAQDEQWRFAPSDSLPEKYKVSLMTFEDQYFKYHIGINPVSMLRAIKQNFSKKKIVSGASTISMQTIRLSRNEDRTFSEKIIEMIMATRLELSYSKDEIMRLYASHAPMGGNVVGIEAAAWRYFGHNANTLSWAEAATLAVLPNSPAIMHFGRNRAKLLTKRNMLLKKLYDKGALDKIDYELSVEEPLPIEPYALPQVAPHLVTKIHKENKGQYIKTTINKSQQQLIENILNRWNAEFSQNEIRNIAAIVIDIERNEVLAYCGNVHFDKSISANQVDILQSPRSTGSILKPFLYCAMLDNGQLLPNQLLPDVPININGFTPKNFSLNYDGAVPASESLARSLNIPFVVSLRKYGVAKFTSLLKTAGMTTLTRSADDYGLSLILGGSEGKLWDISLMYTNMAQSLNDYNKDQKYRKHKPASYIYNDAKEKELESTKEPLFSAGAIWQTFDALTNLNRPEEIDWRSIPSIQKIAWKTGTSFGFRDGWAIGVNPKYTVGVWVGNSDGEGRPGLVGARTAGMVMFDIFNVLPTSKWFSIPENDLITADICSESGLLSGINCPESSIVKMSITKRGLESTPCPYHIRVNVSEDFKYRVYEDCAEDLGIIQTSWFVLPTSWEWFYKEKHPSYRTLPSFSPKCESNENTKIMEFIYPAPNAVISLPKQLDGTHAGAIFELAHSFPSCRVFWHLDGTYVGETDNFHKKNLNPSIGKHKLTVVDEKGNSSSINFTIK